MLFYINHNEWKRCVMQKLKDIFWFKKKSLFILIFVCLFVFSVKIDIALISK